MGGTNYYIESLLWKVLINTKVLWGGCESLWERVNPMFRADSLQLGMVLSLLERGKENLKPLLHPVALGDLVVNTGLAQGLVQGCPVPLRRSPALRPGRPATGKWSWSSWTVLSSTGA